METPVVYTLTTFLEMGSEVLTWLLAGFLEVITFVTSHWLTLLGVILFVVVMVLSSVRRFY